MYRQSEKKNLLSSNISCTCPHNMLIFGLLEAEIRWQVWGTLQISTGFTSWQRYCTALSSGRQPNFAALNRGRHLYSAGRPSRWALAHILVLLQVLLPLLSYLSHHCYYLLSHHCCCCCCCYYYYYYYYYHYYYDYSCCCLEIHLNVTSYWPLYVVNSNPTK